MRFTAVRGRPSTSLPRTYPLPTNARRARGRRSYRGARMAKKPSPKRPVGSRAARECDDYKVGYGRPPKHGQFPPGKSGNPKGRPRRHQNFGTVFETALNETVGLREGEKVRLVSKKEALVRTVL